MIQLHRVMREYLEIYTEIVLYAVVAVCLQMCSQADGDV